MKEEEERKERLERARRKKEELLERLKRKKEIYIVKVGKNAEWIRRKQAQWREIREKEKISEEEEEELRNKIIEKIPERRVKSEIFDPGSTSPLPSLSVGKGTMLLEEGGKNLKNPSKSPKKSPESSNLPSYLKKIVAKSPKIILKPPRLELKNSSENEKNESKKSQNPKNRLKCGKTGEKRAKSEMSFCQPEVKIGQIIENIEEIGPKLLKSKTELRQNDGFLDLVTAEGERGDPPRSTVFEVDTIFDTENGDTEKMSKNSVVLTSREPGLKTQILLNNTPKK